METVEEGETVLLREGAILRWVRILQLGPVQPNGTQRAIVQNLEQHGRAKQRSVTIGGTASIERRL